MKEDKKKKVIKVLGIVGLFLLVFGLSYALFRITLTGKKKTKITTATFNLELLDKDGNSIEKNSNNEYEYEINLDKAVPETDEDGMSRDGFVFKLKNSGNIAAKYTIYLDDVELAEGETRIGDQYVKYSLTKNDSEGAPTLLNTLTERKLDTGIISNGATNEYELKVWIDNNAGIEASNKVFNTVLRVEGEQFINKTPFEVGTMAFELYNNSAKLKLGSNVPNEFNSETETDGLYEYTDKEGTSTYVYRGINPNNYVTFAGSTWRVLRIQEDGTVKLIKEDALNFASDKVAEDRGTYKDVRYNNSNSSDEDSKYVGSNVKAYVEEWYESEMSSYDNKIVTNTYCSDRTEDHNSAFYQMMSSQMSTMYGIYNRLNFGDWDGQGEPTGEQIAAMTFNPRISCRNEDKVNAKVALITADEYVLAGGVAGKVSNYLVKDYYYWTMSPAGFSDNSGAFNVDDNGNISGNNVSDYNAVRPVVTLKANITISSGNGTSNNPYVIG